MLAYAVGAVGCQPMDAMSQGWDPKHSSSAVAKPRLMRALRMEQATAVLQACHKEATPQVVVAEEHGLATEALE
jgi:hypothetical protein